MNPKDKLAVLHPPANTSLQTTTDAAYPHNQVELIEDTLFVQERLFRSARARLRVTTFRVTCPRYIWPEVMAHRTNARNAASSRAIPTRLLLEQVRTNPVIPIEWGSNKAGMQAGDPLEEADQLFCRAQWLAAANEAADRAEVMVRMGVHKQVVNRLLEPYLRIQAVITWASGELAPPQYAGFQSMLNQRLHKDAQPEFQDLARKLHAAMPQQCDVATEVIGPKAMHAPFSAGDPVQSVARCARVSYLKAGTESSPAQDAVLYDKLRYSQPAHASPFEHVWFCTSRGPETLRQRLKI